MRLTILYGALFLLSGAGLLAITYGLVLNATSAVILEGQDGFGAMVGPSAEPVTGSSETQPTLLRARAQAQRSAQLHQLLTQSAIALACMAVVSIALGWFVAGRVLRPLRVITAAARDISATNLHERLALDGPHDELKQLGDTFDGLLSRLESSFQSQHRFVANASHELRTPIARQRALIQVALSSQDATAESLRTAHERALVANRQQERLVEALLTLARGDAGLERGEHVDLAAVADQVLLTRASEAAERGLRPAVSLERATTLGDAHLVEQLVANLLDNALRHNVTGGQFAVVTRATPEHATVTVTNTGPVIAESETDRLFQPFHRLGANRTRHDGGFGLGLSIVRAIATAHGATITAHPRPGGGMRITATFPAAGPSSRNHDR